MSITLARAADRTSLAKVARVTQDGTIWRVDPPPWPSLYEFEAVQVATIGDLHDALTAAAAEDPAPCALRAEPLAETGRRAIYDDAQKGPAGMRVEPRSWVGYDLDDVPAGDIDPLSDPDLAVSFARRCLPPEHHDASLVWQISASAGFKPGQLRLRLWFMLDRPLLGRQVARWCARAVESKWLDPSTLKNEVIPHFLAVRLAGGPDPCPQRWGIIRGARDTVPTAAVPDDKSPLPGDAEITIAGNLIALENKYGGLLDQRRRMAIREIRDEIERVRSATSGNRHATYLEASARVDGLCRYWGLPLDRARARLEKAYLDTLTPDEAKKRASGSTKGIPSWLDRRQPA